MDLIWMSVAVKYSFGRMDGVSYNNYLGDVIDSAYLIDITSDSKEFSFRTHNKGSVMNCFDNWVVEQMDVRYGCCDIILDTSVGNHKSGMRIGRATKSYFVKFLATDFVMIFFFFID